MNIFSVICLLITIALCSNAMRQHEQMAQRTPLRYMYGTQVRCTNVRKEQMKFVYTRNAWILGVSSVCPAKTVSSTLHVAQQLDVSTQFKSLFDIRHCRTNSKLRTKCWLPDSSIRTKCWLLDSSIRTECWLLDSSIRTKCWLLDSSILFHKTKPAKPTGAKLPNYPQTLKLRRPIRRQTLKDKTLAVPTWLRFSRVRYPLWQVKPMHPHSRRRAFVRLDEHMHAYTRMRPCMLLSMICMCTHSCHI